MIMNVLKEDVSDASLMELLYAGNLVLCGESLNEVMDEHGRWKALEGKNLRINVGKTKGIQLLFGTKSSILKMDSCGVCFEWVVVILFSVRNVRGGFINVLMDLSRWDYYQVGMSLSVEHVLVIIVQ